MHGLPMERLIAPYHTPANMAMMQGQRFSQTVDEELNIKRLKDGVPLIFGLFKALFNLNFVNMD